MISKSETGVHSFKLAICVHWCTTGIYPRPLLFHIFMDNLSYVIEMSILSTYAYDTQIFYTANELSKVEETISNDKCGIYYYIHGIYGLCEKVWRGTVQNIRRWCWEKAKNWSASAQVWVVVKKSSPKTCRSTDYRQVTNTLLTANWQVTNKLEMVNKWALCCVPRKSSTDQELCKHIGLSSLWGQRLAKILSTVISQRCRTCKLMRSCSSKVVHL